MPDDPRCDSFILKPSLPPPLSMEELSSKKLVPGTKRLGTANLDDSRYLIEVNSHSICVFVAGSFHSA